MNELTLEQKKEKLRQNKLKALQKKTQILKTNKRDALSNRKLIHKSDYIQYDISTTKDTKGGYIIENGGTNSTKTLDDWKQEQEEIKKFAEQPLAPPIDIKNAPKCFECQTIDINQEYFKVYKCRVCNKCKEANPEKYSLLTKTECKQDYFLTESELMDTSIFNKIEKNNPHAKFSRMQLFLRYQIEEFAFKKWGGEDGLDKEWLNREKKKLDKKTKNFDKKLKEMKKRTRAEEFTRKLRSKNDNDRHIHDFSTINQKNNLIQKKCKQCGFLVEELEF